MNLRVFWLKNREPLLSSLFQRPSKKMKLMLKNSVAVSYCAKENKACIGWVDKYFKDCLCNLRDEFSFGLGIVSLLCWGVAEVPQIITNFRTKTSHGVSLIFLLTWIAGDIFNLAGCLLEPATLPTQYYTALLYTASTVILVGQALYYDHIYSWWKSRQADHHSHPNKLEEAKKPLNPQIEGDSSIPIPKSGTTTASSRREFYYTSARSLAGSATPPIRSYLWTTKSGPPSAMGLDNDSSDEDESTQETSNKSITQPKPIPRSAGYGAFLATSLNLPKGGKALSQVTMALGGRRLLQEHGGGNEVFGQWLGWAMAAIYMGGRFPQIVLNIKRGSVEGLNPLMFIFALIANATYVGSILVRSTEWEKIRANLPWLLDAAACVVLDGFIISQYVYYKYLQKRSSGHSNDEHDDYSEASKSFVS